MRVQIISIYMYVHINNKMFLEWHMAVIYSPVVDKNMIPEDKNLELFKTR